MGADQGLDDRQTEAGAGASRVGARAVGSIEAFEDPVGLFLGQAGSLVGDFEAGVAVGDADADRGAGGDVGDGVADQVRDDLAQGGLVGQDRGGGGGAVVGASQRDRAGGVQRA